LVVLFIGDCPARRSGLERSFFCLENENRIWYTQEISPNGSVFRFFGLRIAKSPHRVNDKVNGDE